MADNDRTLLEKAARAAGYWEDGYRLIIRDPEGWLCIRPADDKCLFQSIWAPLSDDGDALRLAVKLGLFVDAGAHTASDGGANRYGKVGERDPDAATRRAIVRAAASLSDAEREK